jgi:hypothetical protein
MRIAANLYLSLTQKKPNDNIQKVPVNNNFKLALVTCSPGDHGKDAIFEHIVSKQFCGTTDTLTHEH